MSFIAGPPLSEWGSQDSVRYPLCRALTGADKGPGTPVPAMLGFEVTQTNHYQAARYHARFRLAWELGFGPAWWGQFTDGPLTLAIEASLDGRSWTRLVLGDADRIRIQPAAALVEVEGRDLAARLIDTRTRTSYRNRTASEVAQEIASGHSLQADVDPTRTPVQRYFKQDHDLTTSGALGHAGTEWDLLANLAGIEGFDLWMDGTTLHFKRHVEGGGARHAITWDQATVPSANAWNLDLSASTTLAKDVVVEVRSFHSGTGQVTTATSQPRRAGKRGAAAKAGFGSAAAVQSGKAQRWVIQRPNLTPEQAQKLANDLRKKISEHERLIDFTRPADLTTTPRDTLAVSGFGGTWDDTYYIAELTRRMSVDEGFVMTGHAKNHPASSDPAPL